MDQYGAFGSDLGSNPCYTDELDGQASKVECISFEPSVVLVCEDFFEDLSSEDENASVYTCKDKFQGGALFENPQVCAVTCT